MKSIMLLSAALVIPCLLLSNVVASNPKRGIAFAESNGADVGRITVQSSQISWVYDWGTTAPSYLANTGITYIPMQWGTGGIQTFANAVKAQGSKIILGFNEPDFASQSNIDPQTAASLWKQYIQPLKGSGIRLGAPAVTSASSGAPWLSTFIAACNGCTFDFIPLHWYGDGIGPFYDYIWSMHGQFPNWPIWVTEYASTNSNAAVANDFLNQTMRYMDTLDWLERYAYFAFFRDDGTNQFSLLNSDGSFNTRGQLYITT